MEPETEGEALPVNSTNCESSLPAYSPHTKGFPPTSHPSPSNPFSLSARKVMGGLNQVKGSVPLEPRSLPPPAPPTATAYFLRPSKLEAGLGPNIFASKQHSTVPDKIEPNGGGKKGAEEDEEGTPAHVHVNNTNSTDVGGEEVEATGRDNPPEKPVEQDKSLTVTREESGTQPVIEQEELGGDKDKVTETETTSISPSGTLSEEPRGEYGGFNAPPVGFVFGSNLDDRVENVSRGVPNGDGPGEGMAGPSTSLSPEVTKRKWDDSSTVTTGEEQESNVMHVTSCRLFAFDVENSNWIERGRGNLRLNDRKEDNVLHSRLIVRTKGSLRVMLNTPVFPQMVVERSSEKCVKITGREDGGSGPVKLFLIQCAPSDAETLHSALEWRVRAFPPPSLNNSDVGGESGEGSGSSPDSITSPDSKVTLHQGHFDTSPPKKPKLSE